MLAPWRKSYDKPRQHIKKQRHYFANKGLSSQNYDFSISYVRMWELDHKEGWAPKNWCFWTVVLEKTLESPLDCKEIQPVHPKGNQSSVFTGRTDTEAETPILLATSCKELILQKRLWCWGRLKAGGEGDDRGREGDDRGRDGWMISLSQWIWVWVISGRRLRTGKPGMLQTIVSQRVRHD